MLQIKHLTLTHKKDLHVLLRDFELVLNAGDRAVVIGEEGNGKSTLLRWIYDPALVEPYAEASGERVCRGKMAYLPQELTEEEKHGSVYAYFSRFDAFWNAETGELRRIARELGLPGDLYYSEQTMASLSGGERVKLQMARICLERPDLLLLDEPSNDIDIETLEWLERLIRGWEGAVLFISHDETLIENTANRVVLLEQLRHKTIPRWSVANTPYAVFAAERRRSFEKQEQLAGAERREERDWLLRFFINDGKNERRPLWGRLSWCRWGWGWRQPPMSERALWVSWLAWASMEVPAWTRTWFLVNSVDSVAMSVSRM